MNERAQPRIIARITRQMLPPSGHGIVEVVLDETIEKGEWVAVAIETEGEPIVIGLANAPMHVDRVRVGFDGYGPPFPTLSSTPPKE